MIRMSTTKSPHNQPAFGEWLKAIVVIGSMLAAVLLTMALAGANSHRLARAQPDSTEASDLRAIERYLQRSGALSGYQNLL